jgi:flagellar protein FliO/FliZ
MNMEWMHLMVTLGLLLGAIFLLCLLLMPLLKRSVVSSDKRLRVVARLGLSSQQQIILVQVGGQQILVSVCPQSIQTLHIFPQPVLDLRQEIVRSPADRLTAYWRHLFKQ